MSDLIEITIPVDFIELTINDTIEVSIEKNSDVIIDVSPMGSPGPKGGQGIQGIQGIKGDTGETEMLWQSTNW